jgi:hypothetical protein
MSMPESAADRVGSAEEHLKTDVRNFFAQAAQALPRTFAEETHRRVEGCATPHFQREKLRHTMGDRFADAQHVVGAHASGNERLVGIAQGGVGNEQTLLSKDPLREFLGTELE